MLTILETFPNCYTFDIAFSRHQEQGAERATLGPSGLRQRHRWAAGDERGRRGPLEGRPPRPRVQAHGQQVSCGRGHHYAPAHLYLLPGVNFPPASTPGPSRRRQAAPPNLPKRRRRRRPPTRRTPRTAPSWRSSRRRAASAWSCRRPRPRWRPPRDCWRRKPR